MVHQDNTESIHAYDERFIEHENTMVANGAPDDPEYLQVRHFLQQLDRSKYGKFLADLHTLVTSGDIPSYPRTLLAEYNLVKERVKLNTLPNPNRSRRSRRSPGETQVRTSCSRDMRPLRQCWAVYPILYSSRSSKRGHR